MGGMRSLMDQWDCDFTIEKYEELCKSLLKNHYSILTVENFFAHYNAGQYLSRKIAIMRHDVDRNPKNALLMAKKENSLGIHATYYFRYPYTFKPDLIHRISELGHEIGYHYEVLSKLNGDLTKSKLLFETELKAMREICVVNTICMHGSPMSKYDNRELWKHYNFQDYGIKGEAYLSMENMAIRYLTDTGRSWNGQRSIRDILAGTLPSLPIESTDQLINWINTSTERSLYITVHPERWAPNTGEWIMSYSQDLMMNAGKNMLRVIR